MGAEDVEVLDGFVSLRRNNRILELEHSRRFCVKLVMAVLSECSE